MKLESFGKRQRYALVLSGGAVDGQRPRTALFLLHGIRPDGDFQGQRVGAKSRRRIDRRDVLAIWRGEPAWHQIEKVRAKLPVVQEAPARATDAARLAVADSLTAGLRDIFGSGA